MYNPSNCQKGPIIAMSNERKSNQTATGDVGGDFIADDDIRAFLNDIVAEPLGEGSIFEDLVNVINADSIAGAAEIDDALQPVTGADLPIDAPDVYDGVTKEQVLNMMADPVQIGGADKDKPTAPAPAGNQPKPDKPARETDPPIVYPDEKPLPIDPTITANDMLTVIYSEIKRKKIAGHHIDSMNSLYRVGVKQIATKVFLIDGRIKNTRDKTDEDREITDIYYKVEINDINLTPPSTTKYKSGSVQALTPGMARTKNMTYSAQVFIDATVSATATYKNGTTKTRTGEIKDHRIASIPCMTQSELCTTYGASRETMKFLEEDPTDIGGVFIIKGGEWSVDNLENITNNTFHVHKNMHMNEVVRGTFLSKPGDAFENSYQVILRYLNNGAITVEITTNKFDKFEIPYYLLFRALGMTSDRDIVNHIVYGVDNEDPVTKRMMEILERAFEVDDAKFGKIRTETNPVEIINFIGNRITETASVNAKKDENVIKYLNNNILSIIDRYIFPHIGTGIEHRIKKLRFFGHLIHKMLRVDMEVMDSTDRDSYKNKRVHAAGTSIAKAFKTDYNFTIAQECKKNLTREFKGSPFSHVQLVDTVKSAINSEDLERMLIQAITTGNKTLTIRRNEITNRVSSQSVYRKNDLNVKSIANTINTPNTSASKQNERADEMRRVHPTYLGYIDISQSADTGEKVGMSKQLACTASVCGAFSSFVVKRILEKDPDIILLDEVLPEQISAERLAKVFVNGDWIGCCKKSHELVAKYRNMRRHDDLNAFTSIVWEPSVREVYFWTDVGRLMRPLVIVYNNRKQYVEARRKGDRKLEFHQWIKLTKKHIRGLQTGALTMDDLRKDGIIEYISPEEQENALIADNITVLRQHEHDVTRPYTHMDIDQAIFGIVTLASPMANHSNAVRNTMYTNHRKQSTTWYALNWPYRIDKNVTLQYYCERPLVSCFTDALTLPNGQNTIVALALYGGENQEDSVKANRSSIDCGMFNASHFNYEKAELEKGEQFGNPDYARTMDIKKDAIYEYVQDGFIREGTIARKGYVLIVKAAKIPKPDDQYLYVDKSVVYKSDEPVFVERVVTPRNDEDTLFAKVKLRASRPIGVGDKVSSRTGNKGIVAKRVDRTDMLYTEDGLTPDLIVNAHSIPTRMAVNQIIECLLAQVAVETGSLVDQTSFKDVDLDGAIAILEKHGIKYGGHKRCYNGKTGDWVDTMIFIGPTTYQRLQKFVIDEHYSTRSGPTSALTRQPLDGRANDGGLRIGEMEKDVFCAHGTMRALFEKFYKDSDGIEMPVCRMCGNKAVVNEKLGIYKCKYCGDNADIASVASSWVASLFTDEADAMNIKMKFELEKFEYPKLQDE